MTIKSVNKFSGLYAVKIVCGLFAISANVACFNYVAIRNKAARANDAEKVRKLSWSVWIWWGALPIGMHSKKLF